MKKEDLKVGDKVLLKNKRGDSWNIEGKMDHYIGKVVTIDEINTETFAIKEDDGENGYFKWQFDYDDIELKVNCLELKDLQFADILTLRNGQKYVIANDHMFGCHGDDDFDCDYLENNYNNDLTNEDSDTSFDIIKVERYGQVIYEREKTVKKMTVSEICKELGYDVEIVKENEHE